MQSKKNIVSNTCNGHLYFDDLLLQTYKNLLWCEYRRWNFEKVFEIYDYLETSHLLNSKQECYVDGYSKYIFLTNLCYELALIRSGASNANPSRVSDYILEETKRDPKFGAQHVEPVVNALRSSKKFDTLVDLLKKLLLIPNFPDPATTKVSLLVTYIERYRVEFHQRSKRKDFHLIHNLHQHIKEKHPDYKDARKIGYDYCFALAQWYYLCHKLSDEKHIKEKAIRATFCYLEKVLNGKWIDRKSCSLCHQAPTDCEVKFRCSECKVVSYCSIDHQHLSWKENEMKGMCFGHKAFCPVIRAYHKGAKSVGICDKEKLQQKFGRRCQDECLEYLANGLKLDEKCFLREDLMYE